MTVKNIEDWKKRFLNAEKKLYNDKSICKENIKVFKDFYNYLKRKLKRINGLRELDQSSYRTLYFYITRLRTVNNWFENKPWIDLTEKDILKVYDNVEDGVIVKKNGEPFKDRDCYYKKVMKGKPFEIAGKKEIVKDIIEFKTIPNESIRFIYEDSFRTLVNGANKERHKLLLWLAFDYGENINSLLKLKKKNFFLEKNPYDNEQEYRLELNKEILKRSRKARAEINNYKETFECLYYYLSKLDDDDYLFTFGYTYAAQILNRIVTKTGVKCVKGEKVTWKDLRSSMACDCLKKGFTTDEVNARLGHSPSSREINKYVDYLAIDRHRPKKKIQQFEISKLKEELEAEKQKNKIESMRRETDLNVLKKQMDELTDAFAILEILKKKRTSRV